MKHLHLPFYDPCSHAAAEESCYRAAHAEEACFLTYINGPSVHIGRHQSLPLECDRDFCRSRNIPVIRRISGGGAVYHDRGVLNYAFAVPRTAAFPEAFIDLIAEALNREFSLKIRRCSRCSLWLNDRKVGGSAFAMSSRRLLVHGTLLVRADLNLLENTLHSPLTCPETLRAVHSVHSPVMNLSRILPDLTAEKLSRHLHEAVRQGLPGSHFQENWNGLNFMRYEQKFTDQTWQCRR